VTKPIIEKRKNIYYLHFHSFSFRLLLEYFGLLNKKSFENLFQIYFLMLNQKFKKLYLEVCLKVMVLLLYLKDKAVYGFNILQGI
jgi:hypothetical protein